jgi:hypothetical protein
MHIIHVIILLLVIPSIMLPTSYVSNSASTVSLSDELQRIERVYAKDLSSHIFHSISLHQYKQFIIKLTENGSREVGSEANEYSRKWIANKLVELSNGRIEVEIIGKYMSVVGRLPGYLPNSTPCIMVGGHYDSVAGAPGANDDGTGVATVLELARVMSGYEWPLDIYFCTWNAEEVGLLGSRETANIFADRGLDILPYYNIDMLLVEDPEAPPDERVLMVYEDAKYWALLSRAMSNNYGINLIHPFPSNEFFGWSRSDHASFLQAGYEQVLFAFESGFSRDNAYHQPSDTYDNELYNYTVAIETVKAIGASMAFTMAREYGQPTNVTFQGAVSTESTRQYYFPMTTETELHVTGTWSGGGLNYSLYAPSGLLVEFKRFTKSSLSTQTIMSTTVNEAGIFTLRIEPSESSSTDDDDDITSTCLAYEPSKYIGFELDASYDTDIDHDGILDKDQFWFDVALFKIDTDGDSISDGLEIILGTSPEDSDTDLDGLPDNWEIDGGTNPCIADADEDDDNDGLTNVDEYIHGTKPHDNDTDADTLPDGYEVTHGLNPLLNDTSGDFDSDGLSNLFEFSIGTSPSDNDTDHDEIPDGWEIAHLLNPLIDDADLDPDGDTISNLDEYALGLDPQTPDSRVDFALLIGIPVVIIAVLAMSLFIKRRQA